MKKIGLTLIALLSFGAVKAAEVLRAPAGEQEFKIKVERVKTGRNPIYLTKEGYSRGTVEANETTTLWHENIGNFEIYGRWTHPKLTPLSSLAKHALNTVECVKEDLPEGKRYECVPSSKNSVQQFEQLAREFERAASITPPTTKSAFPHFTEMTHLS